MRPLSIEGAWLSSPAVHRDDRGAFHEMYRADRFTEATGQVLDLAQVNCSVTHRGGLRGVHFADVPPGQAKYVSCVSGTVLDAVVDIRVGSPTFGQWELVELTAEAGQAVYLSEGLGHAFLGLSESATVVYLCSTSYAPTREHGVHPLDPALGIGWPSEVTPVLSDKDSAAPSLAEAEEAGLLPQYDTCVRYRRQTGSPKDRP